MKRVQRSLKDLLGRRPLLFAALATTAGLALWGTAQTTEPTAGEGPQLVASAATDPAAPVQPGDIDFPRRESRAESGATLFSEHSWYVPPPPPPPVKPVPPPPPTAPPLPFTFLGSYGASGGGAVYYLVRGDQVLDVKVGDTIDGVYSVDAAENGELRLTYLPLKQQQALSLRR